MSATLPHATLRLAGWIDAWRRHGRLVLLLDFDGTLAPIVERPEMARPIPESRHAVARLREQPGVDIAIVSGRSLADARALAGLEGIAYAGNHGMEIEGPGFGEVHAEAAAARPLLEQVAVQLGAEIGGIDGAFVEDKGLTLSVHYRLTSADRREEVRRTVKEAVASLAGLRVTEGKMVLEIRPRVEWHKGRAVEFLLERLRPPAGAPAIYLGDDTTDEDAFRALAEWEGGSGEGVLVAESPGPTAARSYLRDPQEVASLLSALSEP